MLGGADGLDSRWVGISDWTPWVSTSARAASNVSSRSPAPSNHTTLGSFLNQINWRRA